MEWFVFGGRKEGLEFDGELGVALVQVCIWGGGECEDEPLEDEPLVGR